MEDRDEDEVEDGCDGEKRSKGERMGFFYTLACYIDLPQQTTLTFHMGLESRRCDD